MKKVFTAAMCILMLCGALPAAAADFTLTITAAEESAVGESVEITVAADDPSVKYITLFIDGKETATVKNSESCTFSHAFGEVGKYAVSAAAANDDSFAESDERYITVNKSYNDTVKQTTFSGTQIGNIIRTYGEGGNVGLDDGRLKISLDAQTRGYGMSKFIRHQDTASYTPVTVKTDFMLDDEKFTFKCTAKVTSDIDLFSVENCTLTSGECFSSEQQTADIVPQQWYTVEYGVTPGKTHWVKVTQSDNPENVLISCKGDLPQGAERFLQFIFFTKGIGAETAAYFDNFELCVPTFAPIIGGVSSDSSSVNGSRFVQYDAEKIYISPGEYTAIAPEDVTIADDLSEIELDSVQYDEAAALLTVVPKAPLAPSARYTVYIGENAKLKNKNVNNENKLDSVSRYNFETTENSTLDVRNTFFKQIGEAVTFSADINNTDAKTLKLLLLEYDENGMYKSIAIVDAYTSAKRTGAYPENAVLKAIVIDTADNAAGLPTVLHPISNKVFTYIVK